MKAMLPSMRERKRYVVFEVISKNSVSLNALTKALNNALGQLFGDIGKAKMAHKLMGDTWNQKSQKGIIRVNREFVNHVKAAFCIFPKVGNAQVIVRSIGVSGTMKKANRKFMITL